MKFAQVADVHLNDRVPTLAPYKVGYQVLDKTDDDTRAFGISAYIVDNRWLYIPVFFLDGKLKGSEMMYVKDMDIIVPAMDNWVAHLRRKGVQESGEGADIGELSQMNTPPEMADMDFKLAGDKVAGLDSDPESLIDSATCRAMLRKLNTKTEYPTLLDVPKLGKEASRRFLDTFLTKPDFTNALFTFYTPDDLQKIAHDCAHLCSDTKEDAPDALRIYSLRDKDAADLEDSEKQLLTKHGIYVKDERKNLSKVFHTQVKTGELSGISRPGMYEILLSDGTFAPYIALFPAEVRSKYSVRPGNSPDRVIALIDPKKPKTCHILPSDKPIGRAIQKVEEFLPPVNGEEAAEVSDKGEFVSQKRLLEIAKDDSTNEWSKRILVTRDQDTSILIDLYETPAGGIASGGGRTVRVTAEDGCLGSPSDETDITIPKGSRMFRVVEPKAHFGTIADIKYAVEKTAGLSVLDVYSEGGLAAFSAPNGITQPMRTEAAVEHLTRTHGIFAGQAINMLKEASRDKDHRKRYLVKYAAGYEDKVSGSTIVPSTAAKQVDAVKDSTASKSGAKQQTVLPQQVIDKATAAGEAGIREVFDVEVLKGLLDSADISDVRKDFTERMTQGMDATGRMLFLLYWNMDEFEERFGEDDTISMEENLRETFIKMGDLVLFIKDRNIGNDNTSDTMDGLLSEDMGSAE